MSTILVQRLPFFKFHRDGGFRNHPKFSRISATWAMTMDSKSSRTTKKEDLSIVSIPQRSNDLRFDRLQPSDQELLQHDRFEFGKFVAREAFLDEEYWQHGYEPKVTGRIEQMNDMLITSKGNSRSRSSMPLKGDTGGSMDRGTIALSRYDVKKDEGNVKRTILKSVVGTLDLSIRYLLQGENFPGERINPPLFSCINRKGPNRYGYIANLCVAKSARRQGIASNMLHFAIESAKSNDVEQVYVHVHRDNIAGQQLYKKMGFKMVEMESSQLLEETDLLCLRRENSMNC